MLGLVLAKFMPDEEWIALSQGGIRFDGPNGPWFHAAPDWSANVLGDRQNRVGAIGELKILKTSPGERGS